MKKKQIITTVFTTAVAAATVLTVVAGSITVQAKGEDDRTVLRIAAQPYPLYSSVWVAYELGYLDEELNTLYQFMLLQDTIREHVIYYL